MGRWARTHDRLRRAALELFLERGYEASGTAQIADRAGVSEMTLFRHFPTKESLLLADPFDPLMAQAVRGRPAGEPPMQALVEGIRSTWQEVDARGIEALREVLTLIAVTPALSGAIERNSDATIGALSEALVARGCTPARAGVAATAVIAGLGVALRDWATSPTRSLPEALESALSVLRGE